MKTFWLPEYVVLRRYKHGRRFGFTPWEILWSTRGRTRHRAIERFENDISVETYRNMKKKKLVRTAQIGVELP